MTRKHAIQYARVAGYHDDAKRYTRLIIEARINRQAMTEAFLSGKQARANGVKCNCSECKPIPSLQEIH